MTRTRSMEKLHEGFVIRNSDNTILDTITLRRSLDHCIDATSPKPLPPAVRPDQPLTIVHRSISGGTFNCDYNYPSYSSRLVDRPMWLVEGTRSGPYSNPPSKVEPDMVARCLSKGPTTPSLDIGQFLGELHELPKMIRHAGDLLLKIKRPSGLNPVDELASANLAYKFGWAPFLSDLKGMFDIVDMIAKRYHTLYNAHTHRGVKIRTRLLKDSYTEESLSNGTFGSGTSGSSLRGYADIHAKISNEIWGTVRWRVRDVSRIGEPPTFGDALVSAIGLDGPSQGFVTLWRLAPWSWMIDWFGDVANRLQALQNMIDYEPLSINIMETRRSEVTTSNYRWNPDFYSQGKLSYQPLAVDTVIKSRTQYDPSSLSQYFIRMPILDPYKLSVLMSLGILGLKRGR